ncbi:MAG TPA: hypothetical protein VFG15_27915 [Amycolatopsis sp.]|nr:hypothetical protein [Amycolatopsis sp.]
MAARRTGRSVPPPGRAGESILGATTAVKEGRDEGEHTGSLVSLVAAGWCWSSPCGGCTSISRATSVREGEEPVHRRELGYGHYLIFASAAALGAGLEVAVDYDTGRVASLPVAMATTAPSRSTCSASG